MKPLCFSSQADILSICSRFSQLKHTASGSQPEIEWAFICHLLALISVSSNSEAEVTSAHLELLRTALQTIVCVGVVRHLSPGVGLPLSRRAPSASALLSKNLQKHSDTSTNPTFADLFRLPSAREQLAHVCFQLLGFCRDQRSHVLRGLLLKEHSTDLLAAFIQLSNCDTPSNSDSDHFPKQKCSSALDELCSLLDAPSLLRDLIFLQTPHAATSSTSASASTSTCVSVGLTSAPPAAPVPQWMRRFCGSRITRLVTGRLGVRSLLHGLLHESSSIGFLTPPARGPAPPSASASASTSPLAAADASNALDAGSWRACDAVATILAHCPFRLSAERSLEYYSHIIPQVTSSASIFM